MPSSIFYDPIGSHTGLSSSSPELKWFQLTGIVFRSFFVMTFINSFGDRTYAIGAQRYIYENHNLAIGYGIGLMYGYNGRLSKVKNMPFSDAFLLRGDINPVFGIITDYKIHNNWRINCVITPLVVTIGFRYVF